MKRPPKTGGVAQPRHPGRCQGQPPVERRAADQKGHASVHPTCDQRRIRRSYLDGQCLDRLTKKTAERLNPEVPERIVNAMSVYWRNMGRGQNLIIDDTVGLEEVIGGYRENKSRVDAYARTMGYEPDAHERASTQ